MFSSPKHSFVGRLFISVFDTEKIFQLIQKQRAYNTQSACIFSQSRKPTALYAHLARGPFNGHQKTPELRGVHENRKKSDRPDRGRMTLIIELFGAPKKQNKDAPRSVSPQKAINGRRQYYSATFNYAFLLAPETRAGLPSRNLIRNLIGRPSANTENRSEEEKEICGRVRHLGIVSNVVRCRVSRV